MKLKLSRSKKQPKFINFVKKNQKIISLLFLTIIFFSFSIILTYDSGHYLGYVAIFEGNSPASNWDIVRGPVFPFLIQFSNTLFGKTSTGILICTFIFYLTFSLICYIICKDISQHYKHRKLINTIIIIFLIFNPLIFGYFHVLLTEFVAITITMLNILIAYKWISIDPQNKKTSFLYAIYFILIVPICWHLKQPYIIIALTPPITAGVISLIKNHHKSNVIYRSGTILASMLFLVISIFAWNGVLDLMHVNKNTHRDSSSILSKQLLITYQIPDTDKYNLSVLAEEFFHDPGKIISIYLKNYCSLASICEIISSDGVNYISTSKINLTNTYENTAIGYATYNRTTNLFQMSDEMYNRASAYSTPVSRSIFLPVMKILSTPTNIIFKASTIICLPMLIVLIIFKIKFKNKKYNNLFYLSFILLITASFHLLFSAIALVIDRYSIEAFTPAIIGTLGTITYVKTVYQTKQRSIHG